MDYTPRKLIFKAWNKESKLLMRLNSIECRRGELFKKDHILLQFTGLYDKQEDEIFEMDVLMINHEKFVVQWQEDRYGWSMVSMKDARDIKPLTKELCLKSTRLWSFFESTEKA